jgi:hypothetical protein
MDIGYGRKATILKFVMLEYVARVPYQAWERVGYLALAKYRRRSAAAAGLALIVHGAAGVSGDWPTGVAALAHLRRLPAPPRGGQPGRLAGRRDQ